MRWSSAIIAAVGAVALIIAVYLVGYHHHWFGDPPGPGQITGADVPDPVILARQTQRAAGTPSQARDTQVVFGDFHVHTTYSTDAFLWSLPMTGGRGVHPIGDACDYARYCSGLDFWAITDHASASTPRRWHETKESIRQCQAVSGGETDPDLVSFVGFEWTQVGRLPDDHYGHKNVIFRGLDDDELSTRPIAAAGVATEVLRKRIPPFPPALILTEGAETKRYLDFNAFLDEVRAVPECDASTPSDELPPDCFEMAATPGDLVARLEQQGLDPLLIPHGTSWGFYTPPGTSLDKQLAAAMRPEAFDIVEVMSGHGNSEEYRDWRAIEIGPDGDSGVCPEPSDNYTPSCWRAGEIIHARCTDEGLAAADCDARAAQARDNYANMSIPGHLAVDGETAEDWLDAGQCTDCFLPPFNHRPATSVQYGLAISNFDDGADNPRRFTWGFIASSDNHRARPGTGYKPVDRMVTTEANGPVDEKWAKRIYGEPKPPSSEPRFIDRQRLTEMVGFGLTELERQSSYWITGGLAAAHVATRDRDGIWDALQRREVYGTSGPKMLLWFDLINPPDGAERAAMGSQVTQTAEPRFRVQAYGAFRQKPGCPDFSRRGLDPDRLATLCSGECDHPSDTRHAVTRIEIVRIRPQTRPDEDVGQLIDDPWKTLDCPDDDPAAGCTVEFADPDYAANARDALYYARAIQAPTPTINADALRCEYDADGNCIKVNPCWGDYRTDADDTCTAPAEHRAWSSPIYLTWAE